MLTTMYFLSITLLLWERVAADKCVPFTQKGVSLQGHVIDTRIVDNKTHCEQICFDEKMTCTSINYKPAESLCELNSVSHMTHPDKYGPDADSFYAMVSPPILCNKNYCGNGKTCVVLDEVVTKQPAKRGGDSVEILGGRLTNSSAKELGETVEDKAGTGGGGGSFVYTSTGTLLLAAGGGGGVSNGLVGVDGQVSENGTASHGFKPIYSRGGGTNGNPGVCNTAGGNWHGGVGAGWNGAGCYRTSTVHGEAGGSRAEGWLGGRAGGMNSGYNGGPPPGAAGGFGGGGAEDNGASGGGGGYSGGGSGILYKQAGGGGGSFCGGSYCKGITGGNSDSNGYVRIIFLGL
ncbi:loricrin-like [Nematostella vectensis]|uniref:loricrin-like n=1 Tax=Nematostella vectensis TaxID=45351 RepID=UPI00207733F1|nr:loricrin-like [Nematostella vectensis]